MQWFDAPDRAAQKKLTDEMQKHAWERAFHPNGAVRHPDGLSLERLGHPDLAYRVPVERRER